MVCEKSFDSRRKVRFGFERHAQNIHIIVFVEIMGYCYFLQKGNPDGTIDAWSMWSDCACRIAYWKWPRRVSSVNGLGWVLACKMGMLYGVLLILWRSSEFKIDELNTQLFEFDCGFHPVRRACTGLHETEESCSMADCSCIISQKW